MKLNNMSRSYSASVKQSLAEAEIKKKCCRHMFSDTAAAFESEENTAEKLKALLERAEKCDGCLRHFLAACFVTRGSMTDPEKRNHLDFSFSEDAESDVVFDALCRAGFDPKRTMRRSRAVVYFKDNDTIGDVLAYLGATRAAFDVMNAKIVNDIRNNTNRLVNCDTANIEKALNASRRYVDAVNFIKEHGGTESLPRELCEAAKLRLDFPQASLGELASKCSPPITKSGMKHRLEKLLAAAEELRGRL